MKKILLSLVASCIVATSFADNWKEHKPTTLRDDNLKGNVLGVKCCTYSYRLKFGEPTLGRMFEMESTFYDEKGRSILHRYILDDSGYLYPYSFYFEYEDGENVKVTRPAFSACHANTHVEKYEKSILSPDASFEHIMKTLLGIYERTTWNTEPSAEFIFDKNRVMTSYTIFDGSEIEQKMKGTPTGTGGEYNFAIYYRDGSKGAESQRTYRNGQLVKEAHKFIRSTKKIKFGEEGTFTYDQNGHLILKLVHNQGEREVKYERNTQGDVVKIFSRRMSMGKWQNWVEQGHYDNYQYDEHGNWIVRAYWKTPEEPSYLEKREIIYSESTDELKEKASALQRTVRPYFKF